MNAIAPTAALSPIAFRNAVREVAEAISHAAIIPVWSWERIDYVEIQEQDRDIATVLGRRLARLGRVEVSPRGVFVFPR
jgi:hypothetical protein